MHGDDAVAPPGLLVERPPEQVPADGVHVQPHQYAPADALPVVRRHDARERWPRAGSQLHSRDQQEPQLSMAQQAGK